MIPILFVNKAKLQHGIIGDMNDEDYCVELKAFGFSSKEEAETFHNRLLEEFCKMPEAEHIGCISKVTEERVMDVDS